MADSVSTMPPVLAEILGGDSLSLAAAARLVPPHRGTGAGSDPSRTFRWIMTGLKAQCGVIVKLEAIRTGGKWTTSRAALGRFFVALSADAPPVEVKKPAPKKRGNAGERLKALGC